MSATTPAPGGPGSPGTPGAPGAPGVPGSGRPGDLLRPGTPPRVRGRSTWGLTVKGVRTVATLELRQRVRSTRWRVVLVTWGIVLAVFTGLIHNAMGALLSPIVISPDVGNSSIYEREQAGAIVFGSVVLLVLSLGGLVAPAITATSINGDRAAGVLATVQATLLTPAEIALGKLLAGWATSLALLGVALPFLGWAYLDGGTPFSRLIVATALLALMFLLTTAFALGMSALTARASTSAVLTYLMVATLGVGLPLLFALSLPLVRTTELVEVRRPASWDLSAPPNAQGCVTTRYRESMLHTERIWWLLAADPYVVIADAAPAPANAEEYAEPLSSIRQGIRSARLGPDPENDYCRNTTGVAEDHTEENALPPSWPFGLAADLALGAGGYVLAVRRLRAPARKLSRGTRVA
jgi:ABC-type transport system involved in multi-copper enzyme maturation permease subunit